MYHIFLVILEVFLFYISYLIAEVIVVLLVVDPPLFLHAVIQSNGIDNRG